MSVYDQKEDSYLLAAAVEKCSFGEVLDIGTGSGIQAVTAAKKDEVKSVIATDINDEAIKTASAAAEKEDVADKITFLISDLFSNSQLQGKKFDTIIINPPYLPQDKGVVDEAIYGGKHGYELIGRFLSCCGDYLKDSGIVLMVFSSRTDKQKVDEIIERNCLEFEELQQKHLFFETLYTYLIRKSQLLLQLQKKGIINISLMEKGNRGVLYRGNYGAKSAVVKAKRKESAAVARIENEIYWLKRLNREGIGPELLINGEDWFACEYVDGKLIADFITGCNEKQRIGEAVKELLSQCRQLDKLQVNKEEMLRPQKHVFVNSGNGGKIKVTMVDFERCRKTLKPKNVTQLCQFIASRYVGTLLQEKGMIVEREKLLSAAKDYKRNLKRSRGEVTFNRILSLL